MALDQLAKVKVEDDIQCLAHPGQVVIGNGTRGHVHLPILAWGTARQVHFPRPCRCGRAARELQGARSLPAAAVSWSGGVGRVPGLLAVVSVMLVKAWCPLCRAGWVVAAG